MLFQAENKPGFLFLLKIIIGLFAALNLCFDFIIVLFYQEGLR